jgi:uncharacterized phage protein gp47/JayE
MSSYAPPFIGTAGLTVPSNNAIAQYFVAAFQNIYGVIVSLDNATSDIQLMNVIALAASDAMNCLIQEYANRSPAFAIGAALDSLVKINGLVRKPASYSTCLVTLSGTSGTVITNGIVQDINGNLWNLPNSVTIGGGGMVTVTATAQVAGPIDAQIGQITGIYTPTAGWISVTNGSASIDGSPAESDSALRARQAISTELPSISLVAGTLADVFAVSGVTRANIDENYTGSTNGNGTAAHSIQVVAEGGDSLAIATAIYDNKSIGCGTTGSTTEVVVDPNTGISNNISFNRPTDVPIFVTVNAHLLAGGTTATLTAIQAALVTYLNSLAIGERVSYGALIAVAMSVNSNISNPVVSVETLFFATSATPITIADIILTFVEVSEGISANVIVNSI